MYVHFKKFPAIYNSEYSNVHSDVNKICYYTSHDLFTI